MAELETIVQRFEANTAQFEAAVTRMQAELGQTGAASEQASTRTKRALDAMGAGVSRRTSDIARGTAIMRTNFQQLSFQIQDVIVQLQAGQAPMTILAQQGSQIASIFRGAGPFIGIALAAIGGLGGLLFNLSRGSAETAEAVDDLLKALKELGQQDTAVNRVVESMRGLGEEARRIAQQQIELDVGPARENLEDLRKDLEHFLRARILAIETPARMQAHQLGLPEEEAEEFIRVQPHLIAPVTPEQLDRLRELQSALEDGQIEAIDLVDLLEAVGPAIQDVFPGISADILEFAEKIRSARTEVETLDAALSEQGFRGAEERGLRGGQFTGQQPIQPVDLLGSTLGPMEREIELLRESERTHSQIAAQMSAEKERGRELTEAEAARLNATVSTLDALKKQETEVSKQIATFAGILAPIERENELLAEGLLSREEIAGLLRAEQTLKRELSDEEQQLLASITATNTELKERQRLTEANVVQANRNAEQESAQIQQEGAQVFVQTRTAAEAYSAEIDRLGLLLAEKAIDQETFNRAVAQARIEMEEAGTSIEQMALHYEIAIETSRIFASTLASGVSDAIFSTDSLTDKLARMGQSLAQAVTEAIIFQSVMRAIGAPGQGGAAGTGLFGFFGGGAGGQAPPLHSTGAGGAGFSFPAFGGPRASGGPVLPGVSYLVGERGPERFVPGQTGSIVPNGGGGGTQIVINDQRGRGAPAIEQNVDALGVISMTIRSEVTGMMRDGSLNRGMGVRQKGIARG